PERSAEQVSPLAVEGRSLQVRLLGGQRVVDQRFYQPEGQEQAMDWENLRSLLEKQRTEDRSLKVIEIVLFKDSVDRDNPAVTQLETWAKEHGLTTRLVLPPAEGEGTQGKTPTKK